MNKLILLHEVKKKNRKNRNNLLKFNKINNEQEEHNDSYITFKEKFNCLQNKGKNLDTKKVNNKTIKNNKGEKNINKIMWKILSLNNNMLLIEFINSIFNDELSRSTKIKYLSDKETLSNSGILFFRNSSYNLRILAKDEYKKFEYKIQFYTKDDENLAIVIDRMNLANSNNIISLSKKREEYKESNIDINSKVIYDTCLIMLNSNMEIPDVYEFKLDCKDQKINYKINIIKSWKYGFKQLFEKNMYLLFPMKVLDLKQRLTNMENEFEYKDLIKDEIIRFFKDMNRYLQKVKEMNLITDKNIINLNLIAIDLLNHFIEEKNNIFIDIKRDIEATLKDIVV